MNYNKVFIAGNITKDIELKTSNDFSFCSFSVATNRSYKNKTGEKIEETEFHNVVALGKKAEIVSKFFKKGEPIFVEGHLKTRVYEKDGVKNYRTEVILDEFTFVNSSPNKVAIESNDTPENYKLKKELEEEVMDFDDLTLNEEVNPEDIPF